MGSNCTAKIASVLYLFRFIFNEGRIDEGCINEGCINKTKNLIRGREPAASMTIELCVNDYC